MGLLMSSNQHAAKTALYEWLKEGFAPLVRMAYVVASRPDRDVFDPTRLTRQYSRSLCDPIGCQKNDTLPWSG